jgi:hypothetical protein
MIILHDRDIKDMSKIVTNKNIGILTEGKLCGNKQ